MDELAKRIYDQFMMQIRKRDAISYWMIDLKDGNTTPRVVLEKHSDMLSRWRAVIFPADNGGEKYTLCENYKQRQECKCMAEYKLAKFLASKQFNEGEVTDGSAAK